MTIVDKQNLLAKKNEQRHDIRVDKENPDLMMEVWIRELTFFDVQQAAQSMFQMADGEVSLNLEGYWRYAFSNWVVRTNPELTIDDMMSRVSSDGVARSRLVIPMHPIACCPILMAHEHNIIHQIVTI